MFINKGGMKPFVKCDGWTSYNLPSRAYRPAGDKNWMSLINTKNVIKKIELKFEGVVELSARKQTLNAAYTEIWPTKNWFLRSATCTDSCFVEDMIIFTCCILSRLHQTANYFILVIKYCFCCIKTSSESELQFKMSELLNFVPQSNL